MGKDPNETRFASEFAAILAERDLTLEEVENREHEVPEEVDFDTFAMYCGLKNDRAIENFTEALMIDEDEMLTEAILPPAGLTTEMWREEIVQDIILLELQLTILLEEANIHDGLSTRDFMSSMTLEELLVRQQLRRLEVLKYQGNVDAQILYDSLDWSNTNEPYPVSCIPIKDLTGRDSAYAPWSSVHAVIWRLNDYESYQRSKYPSSDEINVRDDEHPIRVDREVYRRFGAGLSKFHFNNIVRLRPDRNASTHLAWEAEIMQRQREDLINEGLSFHAYTRDELLNMTEDQLLGLVVYYRIAKRASDGNQADLELWGKLDHNRPFPIRAIRVNGESLGMTKDRIRDKGNPRITRFMRTYMVYGSEKA